MITLDPYDPIDIDPERIRPDLTVAYLVRERGSREAWLLCFGDHAVLWWLPVSNRLVGPNLLNAGWRIGSPYPDAPYWHVSGRFEDALEYMYNGIRAGLVYAP